MILKTTMIQRLAVDTSVLVGIIDSRDKFNAQAMTLALAAEQTQAALVYFDCVVVEAIGALCRRSTEQKRAASLPLLLEGLGQRIPATRITWTGADLPRLYDEAVKLVRQTEGSLNFNDALIALLCRDFAIEAILSFDQDFDQIAWLKRLTRPEDLQSDSAITQ
jgi:predicted nucleic acid-binding protein